MAVKWICQNCGEKISDGIPEGGFKLEKGEEEPIPVDWEGICPLCGGILKSIRKK